VHKSTDDAIVMCGLSGDALSSTIAIGCSAAQMVVRWLAVRQAGVRISARHPREVSPTEPVAFKIWRRVSAKCYE
jgi:hypothetical protein